MAARFLSVFWDDSPGENVEHIAEHGLSPDEVEDVLRDDSSRLDWSKSSGDPMAFGWTATGRYIAVVFELIDESTVYPITAYEVARTGRPNMSNRIIRRVKHQFTAAEKARHAEKRKAIEAEFPPGQPIDPGKLTEGSATLGEYFELQELCGQLRQTREARSMSLAEVQKVTGIDKASISRLERGELANPTIATLNRIAGAFGLRVGLKLTKAAARKRKGGKATRKAER